MQDGPVKKKRDWVGKRWAAYLTGVIGILLFGIELMSNESLVHIVYVSEGRHPVSESLVQEVGDLSVLVDLFVSVEIRLEQIKIAVSKLLKGWLHSSGKCCI